MANRAGYVYFISINRYQSKKSEDIANKKTDKQNLIKSSRHDHVYYNLNGDF